MSRTSRTTSQGPTDPQWGSMADLSDEAKPLEASSMDAESSMGLIDLTSEPDDGSADQLDETELPRNRPEPAAFKRRKQQRGAISGGNNTALSDSDGLSHPRPGPSQPPPRKKTPGSRKPSNARPQSASLVDRSESDVPTQSVGCPGSSRKTTSSTRSRMRTVNYGETSSDSDAGGPNLRQQDRAQQRRDRHQSIPESFQSSNATAPPVTAPRMQNNPVQANGAPRYRPGTLIPSQVPFDQHPQTLANKADNPRFSKG